MIPTLNIVADLFELLRSNSLLPRDPDHNLAVSLGLSAVTFLMTVSMGRPFIQFLRAKKVGKQIRIEEPEGHFIKTGTPTMGGFMITIPVLLATVAFNLAGRLSMLLPVGVLICTATLGAIDDRMSLVGTNREGLAARFKMIWLLAFATVSALILYFPLGLRSIYIPAMGKYEIGLLYIPIAILGISGFANAVNLTDGLDSLAGGTAAVAFVAYGIIAYLQGQVQVVTFCFMMVGSLLGFLWFNAHPAQVFMGDTGALAIGASLATAAFMTGQWLLLPIVGIVFVAETLSVMLQVAYFKWTGGKRIFRMTPIHLHFELLGWSETQITMRFWLISMMAGLLGVALALI
ncbi:phospho-N-acetylmuramoyl-pentapeptide-transferase [Sphaerobacter thermophilus]|jgi:phospho-N-acetylmuramoyl-pentapeptide-transferase|uniref:Phospho-N-acetylmuramoyl-pentapeptide-transferase n=1 Tax=Sphaerobacter thermophilus (strain ATCC 49802 / DSM 20745 / KCCM 41009 / NCIMB 13125 / S 6022) TaxID=479434 RepID=D1C5A7_SPHTD|nr:phospho-N-acetylmuramoyl-pentapeptide-transferase [Sphaerobacter thermophilus]ACZ39424.1 phospho-N-acetylmuramoyl-pentapeptide-transferase [Sphaerobacter thermophilus DSM 20745]PZN66164.1 MAG: phospho-N-acetylmuramoyl-pentapeptide-transferase [Sphaerobacter thermophilus]